MKAAVFAGALAALTVAGCGSDGKRYRIPSAAMEPTLHCGQPAPGCEGEEDDLVIAEAVEADDLRRGDIVVFQTPPESLTYCGTGGTFVKRLVGLPGERVELRVEGGLSYVYVDGRRLDEPYVEADRRDTRYERAFDLADGDYFVMGDNRHQSCDSREWGPVPADDIHHRVTQIKRSSGTIDLR